jgi:hypothetical protein
LESCTRHKWYFHRLDDLRLSLRLLRTNKIESDWNIQFYAGGKSHQVEFLGSVRKFFLDPARKLVDSANKLVYITNFSGDWWNMFLLESGSLLNFWPHKPIFILSVRPHIRKKKFLKMLSNFLYQLHKYIHYPILRFDCCWLLFVIRPLWGWHATLCVGLVVFV